MSDRKRAVRLLTFTNLYPNSAQPAHGLFVERRLLRLVAEGYIEAVVVAPVPWSIGRYASYRSIPKVERRHGLMIYHPRFLSISGLGRFIAPFTMMLSALGLARRLQRDDGFDLIDAHYFYPDGVAAALLSKIVGKPLIVTARGTDVNLFPEFFFSRVLIRWAAGVATQIITVSEALREKLIVLGVTDTKIATLRNGVDTAEFSPRDQSMVRARLGLPNSLILLSVGNLIDSKGHDLVIAALKTLPEAYLIVAGDGERRNALCALAADMGVSDRVRFVGLLKQDELIDHYNAADMLVLASLREGMPNVVLEAVSCGLPVVATNCGGIPEVIDRPEMGILMKERSASGVAEAVRELQSRRPTRSQTRFASRQFGWQETIEKQTLLYQRICWGA